MRARLVCLVALLIAGCSSAPTSPATTASPVEVSISPELDPAIVEAMRFRRGVGLRADEEWVRTVAANPAAVAGLETYEIPLLPEEVAFLQGRLGRIEDALAFAESYAAEFPNGYAGAAIDTEEGDRLVLMYTRDVEFHRLRLGLTPEDVRPEVRLATWTLDELKQFQSRVNAAAAPDPRIKLFGADIDILANRVKVNYGAARRDLGEALPEWFGSTGWLVPRWLGPVEPDHRPVGALVVTVVDGAGVPLSDLPCRYTSADPNFAAEGGGDTSPVGRCHFEDVPAGTYRIDILEADERVERLLKSVEVEVAAGTTREVTVVIEDR